MMGTVDREGGGMYRIYSEVARRIGVYIEMRHFGDKESRVWNRMRHGEKDEEGLETVRGSEGYLK